MHSTVRQGSLVEVARFINGENHASFSIITPTTPIPQVTVDHMDIRLLAAGERVEVMHHRMNAGSSWTVLPETEAGEFQYYFVVSGELVWRSMHASGILHANDSLVFNCSNEVIELTAKVDSDYLIFSSIPLFHRHVTGIRDLEQLAIAIEQKDGYTADHCSRIQQLSMQVAGVLGLSPRERFELMLGSFLHDVGKVHIPQEILNKPGPLTTDEWTIMKQHPVHGSEMVRNLNQFCLHGVCDVILQHHERYDGSGYPCGLAASEINRGAAIVAVVDSFDAMTSDRVYQKAKSVDEAVQELKNKRGILFDPAVVDAFLSLSHIWGAQ